MTCYIAEESQSSLKDGIETIVVPIHDPHDMEHLVFHTQRGGVYDVVEWLLSELSRSTELERVVGLTVTPNHDQVVVNLELKQPGLQMEKWLLEGWWETTRLEEGDVEFDIHPNDGPTLIRYLSARALSQGKFTDQHKPWWEKDVRYIQSDLEEVPAGGHGT